MILQPRWNTNNKFCVARVHYSVDPEKNTKEWIEKAKEGISERSWKREYEISYETFAGKPVYETFTEEHIGEVEYNLGQHIYRGWDFGYHFPACMWAYMDSLDRLIIRHELLGHDEGIREFAKRVINLSQEWFPDVHAGKRFLDCCDPAGNQPLSGLGSKYKEGKKVAITSVSVLNDLGIYPTSKGSEIVEGIEIIRQRLKRRNDGEYGLLIHPDCKITIDGLKGGYRYAEIKPGQPQKEEPLDDDYYVHLQDILRYIAVNFLDIAPTTKVGIQSPSENEIMGLPETGLNEFF